MKYGLSRSLNCNSDTDRRSSSTIARNTGSFGAVGSWLREAIDDERTRLIITANFQRVETLTVGLRLQRLAAQESADDRMTSLSFGPQSELSGSQAKLRK